MLGTMFYRYISERLTNYVIMTMHTSNAEKSGGKFFTPATVSELLTRLGTVGKNDNNSLFMDAIGECIKITNNNKLTPENRDKIMITFSKRKGETHYAHLATYEEIEENDHNLSASTYVEAAGIREDRHWGAQCRDREDHCMRTGAL